jgi:glycosyltransferase involved in cell wall biosynthesis/SAM-dependent methyltransferase
LGLLADTSISELTPHSRYRIALWTPLPPLQSGIADYSDELLPFLHERYDVETFVDDGYQVSPDIHVCYKVFPCRAYHRRNTRLPFDLNVYQMGNDVYHLYIYEQLLREPGLVVIHDLSISSMLYNFYVGVRQNLPLFRQEFEYSEGKNALHVIDNYHRHGNNDALLKVFAQHPMLRRLVNSNFAFVTHLEYCTQMIVEKYQAQSAYTMYLGSPDPLRDQANKADARRALNLPDNAFILGVAGYLQGNKQIEVCLRAFARLKDEYPYLLPVLVGPINPHDGYEQHLLTLMDSLGIRPYVRLTGYVPKAELVQYLLACDVQVNLRYPTFGQMSSTLSRGIAAGKPVIITDIPEWRCFPDDFCWRVPPEDTEGLTLEMHLRNLLEDPALVASMGRKARDFYTREGSTAQAAKRLSRIIDDVIHNGPKETVSQPTFGLVAWGTHSEYVQRTYDQWHTVRTAGTRNWISRNLTCIPWVGSLAYKAYRLLVNIYKIRQLRAAETGYYHAIATSLKSIEETINTLYHVFYRETSRLQDEVSRLHEQLYDVREQLIDISHLPATFVLQNPLVDLPRDVKHHARQITDESTNENSNAEFDFAPAEMLGVPEEVIRRKHQRIISFINEIIVLKKLHRPILEIGCGSGEFLRLLKEHGIKAVGIDQNISNINDLYRMGYDVHRCEAPAYLQGIEDNSLGGIIAFNIIEYLPHGNFVEILGLAYKKLAPGGFILLETLNPYCFESLDRCPTETASLRLIQPYQLAFLVDQYQFHEPRLIFSKPVRIHSTLRQERWLQYYQCYGVIAVKSNLEKDIISGSGDPRV